MKSTPAIRGIASVAALSATILLGACAAPNAQSKSAKAADDEPAPTYVTGSRFPVKDKAQTNVQTGSDLQSSGVRG